MYLIRGTNNIELFRSNFPEISTVATIGNFDGLHLGHQQILKTMQLILLELEILKIQEDILEYMDIHLKH